jgi:hypothetical protein
MDKNTLIIVFIISSILFLVSPTLWSINYLFDTRIPIDFSSWCAVAWLSFIFRDHIKRQPINARNSQR